MICKCLAVPGGEIKLAFMREGLCERGSDRIREKEIGVFILPKFVKIASINEVLFQGFLWDSFAIKN